MDEAIRNAEREAQKDPSLENISKEWLLRCKTGEHTWSNFIQNYPTSSGGNLNWESAEIPNLGHQPGYVPGVAANWRETTIATRECLFCGKRQRRISRLSKESKELSAGVVYYPPVETITLDLE